MTPPLRWTPDPERDLVLERDIDVPREKVWAAWTEPEHLRRWFTPAPWTVASCRIDLRPGGVFHVVMRSPEGEEHPSSGCYLEVVPCERLVWTDALLPGYRPAETPFMTGLLALAARGAGTHYRAVAMHRNAEDRRRHQDMGFHEGWGKALDQLVAHVQTL